MAMDINTKNMRQTIANNSVALHLHPIKKDYDELMEAIGPAQFVLIGKIQCVPDFRVASGMGGGSGLPLTGIDIVRMRSGGREERNRCGVFGIIP